MNRTGWLRARAGVMCPRRSRPRLGALVALVVLVAGSTAGAKPPKDALEAGAYPASFRLAVAKTIQRGVERLKSMQAKEGHWGKADDEHVMGHTALALLALTKGGVDPQDEAVRRAWTRLAALPMRTTYSVGVYLLAVHARHAPLVDVFSLDDPASDASRARRDPALIRAALSEAERKVLSEGVKFLLRTHGKTGLWCYRIDPNAPGWAYDLSNTQYALLGLRAAVACGEKVPRATWERALEGVLGVQAEEGKRASLLDYRLKDGYALVKKKRASARGFRYKLDKKDGPKGPWTEFTYPCSGSMTTAGIVGLTIAREGLGRRVPGALRKRIDTGLRDGLAWLQEHFTVTLNPGDPKIHHYDYLYGLERVGMLLGRRWLGRSDWYRAGADHLLALDAQGGWGEHVPTAFAVLFLKRATPPPAVTGR